MLAEDIVNREFSRAFKGYDINEVEEYIEMLIGMYEQLENENKELTVRCAELTSSLKDKEDKIEQAENTSAEADSIIRSARERAREIVATAENTARRLLVEVKAKTESMTAELEEQQSEAHTQAKKILDDAMDEAKKLIRATKHNCAKRQEECERKLAEAEAEYEITVKRAADFREMLFCHYSDQIMAIEKLEIPVIEQNAETEHREKDTECAQEKNNTEVHAEKEDQKVTESAEPVQEQNSGPEPQPEQKDPAQSQPKAEKASMPAAFTPPVQEKASELVGFSDPQEDDGDTAELSVIIPKSPGVSDRRFAGLNVEVEHSGQVHYNSSEIASVNRKLDDIISKKGKNDRASEQSVSQKLSFMK